MSLWDIPYVDQDLSFWQEIAAQFGPSIKEVYFPMPGDITATGRGKQPNRFTLEFLRLAPLAKAVLINPIILPHPVEVMAPALLEALRRLQGDFGIASVTVADLGLARRIRQALPDYRITLSTLARVTTPAQVVMVRDCVDAITPDTAIIHDLPALRRLRSAYAGELRLLVNESCLPGCPYRTQHFYEMGYCNEFPRSLCNELLADQPWLRMTGAWIPPQFLGYYDGLYDTLKLAGRVVLQEPARYFRVLGAYIRREKLLPVELGGGPASILLPIDIPASVFETIINCDKRCDLCRVCRDFYDQASAALAESA